MMPEHDFEPCPTCEICVVCDEEYDHPDREVGTSGNGFRD